MGTQTSNHTIPSAFPHALPLFRGDLGTELAEASGCVSQGKGVEVNQDKRGPAGCQDGGVGHSHAPGIAHTYLHPLFPCYYLSPQAGINPAEV